jgi:protein-S-isoprenylcysteine O-methyltransferase Ste14
VRAGERRVSLRCDAVAFRQPRAERVDRAARAVTAPGGQRRGLVVGVALAGAFLFLGLSALGWGSASGLVAHRARAGFVGLTLAFTCVGLLAPVNFSSGEREDVRGRWSLLPSAVGLLVLFWLVPYLDRRDLLSLDGDAARYLGLGLYAVGGVLRIAPMFVLGHRFSGLVAIQPGHALVTDGLYGTVRHPSYLGMLLGLVGWALVFRSAVGLGASLVALLVIADRIALEESLLASQFGERYAEYRRRTWRLLPGIY